MIVGVYVVRWIVHPCIVTNYGTVLLHGDDDGEVSIGASFLVVCVIYVHYYSRDFFLQVVYAFLCDVADDTGDFLFLSVNCLLDQNGRVGGLMHCEVWVLFLTDFL